MSAFDKEIDQAYTILSTKTGRHYLDQNNACYIYTSKDKAEEFVEKTKDTMIDGPKYYIIKEMMKECYDAGADSISFSVGDATEQIALYSDIMEREFCNHTASQVLAQIKQTRKRSLLAKLSDERFLVPAKIEEQENSVSILYSVAKTEAGDKMLYVAFTDLSEYEVWRSHVSGWNVLEMGYTSLWRIARHHGVLLNPYGNRFVLKRSMMEEIPRRGKYEPDQSPAENT